MGISFFGQLVDQWTSRVSQPQDTSDLVIGFSCCVIPRSTQHMALVVVCHFYDVGMTAGNDKRHKRRL